MPPVNTPCPHRPACPGCDLLELPYPAQIERKTRDVRTRLGAYAATADVAILPCVEAEQREGYRTRVKWVVEGDRIGLYGEGHAVVDTPACLIAPPQVREVAEALRHRPVEGPDARLVALDIRATARGDTVVTLVVGGRPAEAEQLARSLARRLKELGAVVGVAWAWRRPRAPTTLGEQPTALWGETTIEDRVGLATTRFPAGAFSQGHASQTERMHELLRAEIGARADAATAQLVDLYAGCGGIGLALRDQVAEVVLAEAYEPAARAAAESAAGARNVRVSTSPAERAITELGGRRPLFVVVDPPRTGLSARALVGLARLRPDLVLYVSCDPGTLARDLSVLATHGLRATSVTPLDMLPGTSNVEAIATVVPGPAAPPSFVADGPGWALADKPPFLPTVPHPEWPTSLLEIVRTRLPEAAPAHRLDEGTSGLVLLRERGAAGPSLDTLRKVYVALAKGVTHKGGTLNMPLKEEGTVREAHTRYRRVDVVGGHSLLELTLLTGRTHQIRRHLAAVGHPVVGDERYGDAATNRHFAMRHGLIRPFLHAARLVGQDGELYESPLWPDLRAVLDSLKAKGAPSARPPSRTRGRGARRGGRAGT